MSSELVDPSAIRSNRAGEITKDQKDAIKGRYSSLPGCVTLGILGGLFALVFVTVGKTLAQSTVMGIAAIIGILIVGTIISSVLGNMVGMTRMGGLQVEPSPGQVVWKGSDYRAVSQGKVLQPILGDMRDLTPGDYTFYTLRGSNLILSAEPATAPAGPAPTSINWDQVQAVFSKPLDFDPAQSPEKTAQRIAEIEGVMAQFKGMDEGHVSAADIDRLRGMAQKMGPQMAALMAKQVFSPNMRAITAAMSASQRPAMDSHGMAELRRAMQDCGLLNPEALETNKQGQITGGQRGSLMSALWNNLLIAGVAGLLGLVVAYFAFREANWMIVGTALLLGEGIAIVLLFQARSDLADMAGGRAEMAEAIMTKYTHTNHSSRSSRSSTTYYLQVNQLRFSVSHRAYEAILEGRVYRVYYSPSAKKLLNVEPV